MTDSTTPLAALREAMTPPSIFAPIPDFDAILAALDKQGWILVRKNDILSLPTIAAALEGRETMTEAHNKGFQPEMETSLGRAVRLARGASPSTFEALAHREKAARLQAEARANTAERELADKTTALNTAEAEAFELRRLADGMAEALRGYNAEQGHMNARQALTAYAAHIAQGEKR